MMPKNSKSNRRQIFTVTTGILLLTGLIIRGPLFDSQNSVKAQSAPDNSDATGFPCSNRTLKGRYGIKGDGLVPSGPPPAPLVPFAVVGVETLDGQGNLTDAATTSVNGVVRSSVNQGTYTLNEDCTGTYTVNLPVPPFQVIHHVVVVDKGNEVYLIATTGGAVTIAAKRLD